MEDAEQATGITQDEGKTREEMTVERPREETTEVGARE